MHGGGGGIEELKRSDFGSGGSRRARENATYGWCTVIGNVFIYLLVVVRVVMVRSYKRKKGKRRRRKYI